MANYYVNKRPQANGHHEVHRENCFWLKIACDGKLLGYFTTSAQAMAEAKKEFPNANGCNFCSRESHTKDVKVA